MTERLTTRDAELDEATHRLCAENARRWSAEAAYVALVDNSLQDSSCRGVVEEHAGKIWVAGAARAQPSVLRCPRSIIVRRRSYEERSVTHTCGG